MRDYGLGGSGPQNGSERSGETARERDGWALEGIACLMEALGASLEDQRGADDALALLAREVRAIASRAMEGWE